MHNYSALQTFTNVGKFPKITCYTHTVKVPLVNILLVALCFKALWAKQGRDTVTPNTFPMTINEEWRGVGATFASIWSYSEHKYYPASFQNSDKVLLKLQFTYSSAFQRTCVHFRCIYFDGVYFDRVCFLITCLRS